jgi:hypothetical protein
MESASPAAWAIREAQRLIAQHGLDAALVWAGSDPAKGEAVLIAKAILSRIATPGAAVKERTKT